MLKWIGQKLKESNERAVKEREEQAAQIALEQSIREQVKKRFYGRVFFVPDAVWSTISADAIRGRQDFVEDDWRGWKTILDRFPTEPQSQSEAATNEERFWKRLAEKFTITLESGHRDLAKHADIIDWYKVREKWILREYFAATGKVIEPWVKKWVKIILDYHEASNIKAKSDSERDRRSREREKLNDKHDHVVEYEMPAHYEKQGKWFVSHIEDAFKKAHAPPQRPQQNVHGEGGYATAADIRRLDQRDSSPARPGAQTQPFKD